MTVGLWMFHHKSDVAAPPVEKPAAEAAVPKEIPVMSTPATVVTTVAENPTSATPGGGPPPPVKGFVSFLKHAGTDAKKVLEWLASPINQKVVLAGEEAGAAIATAAVPTLALPIAGGLALAERWTREIFKAEVLGAAAIAADPAATNAQKAALAVSAVAPDAVAFAKANGLAIPTGDRLLAANDAIVQFWNTFGISQPVQ